MQMTGAESVELVFYKLKDVSHIQFTFWNENRGKNANLVIWDYLTGGFLDSFFFRELRQSKTKNS